MTIRSASLDDIDAIQAVENNNFTAQDFRLSRASIRYHLKNNLVYVVEVSGEIVGYILWLERKNYFRLYSLAILKSFHSQGLGKALLEYSLNILSDKKLSLEVKFTNKKAISLYEKLGFKKVKTLPSYYPNNVDGILMLFS
ncbi:N-acetyltransferase family protein [Sulfurimonas sp.]|uniref:GNAT family N-acetyltransferase n=1 Tax=Sulfurimonas sp. TaxID=2022749 RepID=UPI003D0D4F1B